MGFAFGSVSFRRFAVVGKQPKTVEQKILDALEEFKLKEGEFGVPEEDEYGWCGGRHVLDGQFSFDRNVFGDAVYFALRIDTNKVPGDIKKAYEAMEEEAVAAKNPSGFISKLQKKEVKESVRQKLEDELRSGKYRRSKMIPILWDLASATVYASVSNKSQEKLMEIFERSFNLILEPLTAGGLALNLLEPKGRRRDYEDLKPTRFVPGPDGESQFPEYPWVAAGPQPKDFLGNEFLLWLWHEADHRSGVVSTAEGDVTIMIDRTLDLDCAYGMTGKDSLKGTGPSHMPEARDALRSGKLPRKAGLILHANGQQFDMTFNPETFAVGGGKLPEVEEAETPRVLFEERIGLLRMMCQTIDALFESFLKIRASSSWESQVNTIRKWILQQGKPVAAVA